MKQIYLIVTILLLLTLQNCSKAPVTPAPANIIYSLQITNGEKSGKYSAGDSAYIFSQPPSSSQVFDKWTGDITNLADPNEWRTTLKMPGNDVNITATYKAAAAVTFNNIQVNGKQVYYYIPANYKGIILPFHGTGGSAINWVSQQAENMNFCRYAIANGYALVITESNDRVNKQWDLSLTANTDIASIDAIMLQLKNTGVISTDKPIFGLGMSNGAAFCSLITYLKAYKAAALYCYGGIEKVYSLSTVPTIWNMAVNDVTDDPNRQTSAEANYNKLKVKGATCIYYVNKPTPIYESKFTIIEGVNLAASTAIYNALKTAGYINGKGFFNVDPAINTSWQAVIPVPYNTLAIRGIEDQLTVSYAQHKFYKDSNYKTIAFFNRFL